MIDREFIHLHYNKMAKTKKAIQSKDSGTVKQRYHWLDQLRAFAMILMAIYHFSFDLNYFGVIHENMNHDPFWLNFRAVIMSLFTFVMGFSFFLAQPKSFDKKFKVRLLKLFLCAAAISIFTYLTNPISWIYFGILHLMFVATFLSFFVVKRPEVSAVLAAFFIILPLVYRNFFFMKDSLIITGLSPLKPVTEDFAPLFPWFGVVCLGLFMGYMYKKLNLRFQWRELYYVEKLGKNSLLFYMTHQFVLMPLAWLIARITQ